jgi:hypothetical protein
LCGQDAGVEVGRLQLPSDAYEEGIEGFDVVGADGTRVGRVAALNRTLGGLVLLVEPEARGESVVALPLDLVTAFDDRRGLLSLSAGADAVLTNEPVPRTSLGRGGRALVRVVPSELLRLVPADAGAGRSSSWWLLSLVLGIVASASALVAHLVIDSAGGGIAWAIVAVPIVLFAAAGAALLAGVDAPLTEKLGMIPASLLGYTPRASRRRGSGARRR